MASAVDKENLVDNSEVKEDQGKESGNESEESEKEDLTIDETETKNSDKSAPIILDGKRQRTAVKAFVAAPPAKEKKRVEFEVGKGTLLGDIDIVTEYMTKNLSESYVALHRLMYNNIHGPPQQRKQNIRRFNGFNFDEDSKQYASKLTSIKKLKSSDRKLSMKLMGLKQTSTAQEFMDFLMCPEDKGRHAPIKKKSKTPSKRRRSTTKDSDEAEKKTPAKKKTPSKSKTKPKPSTTPKRKKPAPKNKATDDEVDDEESLSESLSEEKEEETNASKKRKLSESITDISIDETGSGPSKEELIESIKKTVEDIDLEEVSMKQALAKIYELYPDVDLTDRKSFIKDNIRKLIG